MEASVVPTRSLLVPISSWDRSFGPGAILCIGISGFWKAWPSRLLRVPNLLPNLARATTNSHGTQYTLVVDLRFCGIKDSWGNRKSPVFFSTSFYFSLHFFLVISAWACFI